MAARILKIETTRDALDALTAVGADDRSFSILLPKCFTLVLKLVNVRTPACNILKQLMLSIGGDAAVAKDVLTAKCDASDVLLIGTLVQLRRLVERLGSYPGDEFNLKRVKQEVSEILTQHFDSGPPDLLLKTTTLQLSRRTHVMGVLNCTPDSFSDGGLYLDRERAVERVFQMVEEGADIVDIGGESTRPGADTVPLSEELRRVIPVIESVDSKTKVVVSVDTRRSAVAKEAFEAGASLLNDVSSLSWDPKMIDVAAEYDVPVVLMHMKGTPKNMQENPTYSDLMGEITSYLKERLAFCRARGIERTIVDPGIGFGKRSDHNLTILRHLSELRSLGKPVLVGTSRKSFIGKVLDLPVGERLEGTLASIAVAILNGASVLRVHEVKQAVRVARMVDSLK